VTLAGSLVMAASVMLVVSVFERLGDLRSLESRTAVERFLSEPPGSELGIGLESALTIMRTVSMVGAGLATAAAILGWHVLKRNRAARVALSVLALPLFLCGLVTGGFLAGVVAASVAMLWLAPSRHWFAGTTPGTSSGRGSQAGQARRDAGSPPAWPPQPAPPHDRPRDDQPGGDRPRADVPPLPPPGPPATQQPPPWPPYAQASPWTVPPRGPAPAARPTAVVAACVLTWACCALTALLSILLVAVLTADADALFAEMHRQNPDLADQGVSDATLQSATWIMAITCLLWAAVSSVLAVLAFNRVRWAAIALIVSAGVVALFCLAGSLVSPPLALPGLFAAATLGLLLQPSAQRWLARRDAPRSPA
jgi:hypothetical protein